MRELCNEVDFKAGQLPISKHVFLVPLQRALFRVRLMMMTTPRTFTIHCEALGLLQGQWAVWLVL